MTHQQKNWAVRASIATVLVFVAAFMPWAQIEETPTPQFSGPGADFFKSSPLLATPMKFTIDGWNGTVTLAGIQLPNWTVVLLAVAVTTLAWLVATNAWQPPRYLGPTLAAFGLLQVLLTLLIVVTAEQSTIGLGILLTIAGLAMLMLASMSLATMRRPAGS